MLGSATFGITFSSIFARDLVKIWIEAVTVYGFNEQQHLFFAQDVGRNTSSNFVFFLRSSLRFSLLHFRWSFFVPQNYRLAGCADELQDWVLKRDNKRRKK
jgi:hypothetical protein